MDNPQVLDSLEEIRKAGNRARNLVQQILSFSRRQPFERRPIDLASVVSKCTGLLRSTLPARIEIAMEIESGDFRVMADATQIEQLLINLATNAMQAIPTGPGRIDIQLQKTTLDAGLAAQHASLQAMYARCSGPVARLSVGDTGAGMDAGTLTRIFEPFFTTKALGEGTGLGLSVVHGIVQGHDGAVVVESDLGKGTRFSIYLALDDAVNVRGSTDH